jgi:prepilin-type processing-associated H-X9-DG protein
MNCRLEGQRRGITLLDVVVSMGICLVVCTIGLGGLAGSRELANRTKCADNLRMIALVSLMYCNGERTGEFPRTCYDRANPKVIVDSTGFGKPGSFDRRTTGDNNVPASLYLLFKSKVVDPPKPDIFICPSTRGVPGFGKDSKFGLQDSSNWEAIPRNLTYSYSCPFATDKAVKSGWRFDNILGADVPLAADLNPGGDVLLKITSTATPEQLNAGNSRNHNGEGQNVAYCDGHVEFQKTPFCGTMPPPGEHTSRDNIYTYGGPSDTKGGVGVIGMPVSRYDNVLLPAGDATVAAPAAGSGK